MLIFIIFRIY